MSTRMHVFVTALLLLFSTAPAFADEPDAKLIKEMVYRSNLGRSEDVKMLLDQGVPANQKSEDGTPMIALASARTDDEGVNVLRTLLASGADINAQDSQGRTALFYAAKAGNKKAVQELLDKGINSYAIDNKGDIARTIAFREGKNDVVVQMDKFITDQSTKVNQQYTDANAALAQRYKDDQAKAEAEAKAKVEREAKIADEQRQKAEAEKRKLEAEVNKLKAEKEEQEQKRKAEEEKNKAERDAQEKLERDTKALTKYSETLAMNSCAFQYWYYCREAGQPTELTREEIDSAIETNKDKIVEISQKISALDPDPADYADILSARAKNHIYARLQSIPSRRMRKEAGVGSMSDMRQRCGEISRQWQIIGDAEEPGPARAPAPRAAGTGKLISGGIGTVNKKTPGRSDGKEVYDPRRPPPKIYYRPGG